MILKHVIFNWICFTVLFVPEIYVKYKNVVLTITNLNHFQCRVLTDFFSWFQFEVDCPKHFAMGVFFFYLSFGTRFILSSSFYSLEKSSTDGFSIQFTLWLYSLRFYYALMKDLALGIQAVLMLQYLLDSLSLLEFFLSENNQQHAGTAWLKVVSTNIEDQVLRFNFFYQLMGTTPNYFIINILVRNIEKYQWHFFVGRQEHCALKCCKVL